MSEELNVLAGNDDGMMARVRVCPHELSRRMAKILDDYGHKVSETRGEVVKRRIAAAVA